MAEDNGSNNNWQDLLPPEMRGNDKLTRFKDVGALTKSYLDMETHLSSTGRVPKEDSKPEDWNSYYKHWGRPERPEEYKLPDLPKEYQLEEPFQKSIKAFAHDMGLNQRQFNQMINWGLEQSKGIYQNQAQQAEQATNELRAKWGFSFDRNRERARKTVAMLVNYKADHPFVKWMESNGYDNNPTVLEFFNELSERFGEDSFVDEQTKQESADRDNAAKKIREIQADMKHPYWNERDPRHIDALAEMTRLHQLAYPDE